MQCGHRTLQCIYRTEYKKEQNTRYRPMDLKNSRYLRQNSDLGWTLTTGVLAVANVSAEMRASLTKADIRGNVQSHGGIGEV